MNLQEIHNASTEELERRLKELEAKGILAVLSDNGVNLLSMPGGDFVCLK